MILNTGKKTQRKAPLKARFYCLLAMLLILFIHPIWAQNIFSGEPVQIVGTMNGFSTLATFNSTYRRVSVSTGNPADGRGQWVKTYNAQASGGDVTNSNMPGGATGGFLFISGPSTNRFQNKWVFTAVAQAKLDSVNTCTAYNSGNDMGLNMSTTGRYTFVFNDCGYTATNARYYVGYTSNAPVTLSNASQLVNTNNSATVGLSTSAAPSAGENVYVRYTLSASGFASTNTSFIVQASSTNSPTNTNWSATIPAQATSSSISYYFFTSTLSLAKLTAMSETDRSLCALNVLDNSGNNYSYSLTRKYTITFNVDLANNICFGGFDSVTVTGSAAALTTWGNGVKLVKNVSNQLHSISLVVDSGATLQYKFRYHKAGVATWEGNFATTSTNRELVLTKDSVLATPCFNSLSAACAVWPAASTVTFLTDLSKTTPDPLGRVYVMGTFTSNTWASGALRMFPVTGMPGYYQRIVTGVCPGTFEYKFVNGDSSLSGSPETFPNPAQRSCTVSNGAGGYNRTYTRIGTTPVNLRFVFDSCSVALPVNLVRFEANYNAGSVELNWATASEENNKGFAVERSLDGKGFIQIGFVSGKGTSAQLNKYSFADASAFEKAHTLFYRLKQIDFDGASNYSQTVSVQENAKENGTVIHVSPNPFENTISILANEQFVGSSKVQVIDLQGRIIEEQNIQIELGLNQVQLCKTAELPGGVYYLKLSQGELEKIVRLIKK
ncbi:MAG: hypothetical protein CFE21_04805 [Bacteroidetes bacterium B1(2017)]|nr:MAG: hypothetical protein CFE21_04805 [Bacteroidetes bacterium B1(2017)]